MKTSHPAVNLVVRGRSTPVTFLAKIRQTGESAILSAEIALTKSMLGMKKANLVKSWMKVNVHFDRA